MYIYDFDGTIYDGDATIDFYFYCLKENKKLIKYVLIAFINILLALVRIKKEKDVLESFFKFVTEIDDIDLKLTKFWKINNKKIKQFYLNKKNKNNDIVISASPTFVLEPICKKLKIKDLIATNINKKTGELTGLDCRHKEKVRRLYEKYINITVKEAYSDSFIDKPLMDIANAAYLVRKNKIKKLK